MVRELRRDSAERDSLEDEAPSTTVDHSSQPDLASPRVRSLPPGKHDLLTRIGFLAAAGYAFASGMRVYEGAGVWTPGIVMGLTLYAAALLSLAGAFWVRNSIAKSSQIFLASVILISLFASVAYEITVVNRTYGTDSIAFAHYGGELLLRGENPYAVAGQPLGPIIERFGIPETFVTRSTSGGPIDRLISYPGGHVLAYTGALALGFEDLRWATLVFEIGALAVIWWALSPSARLLIPLVLLIEPNLSVFFTSGGVTDWLWVLPLAIAAIMLHREHWGYAGIALGIACAIKQQPWFAVPFVLVWVYMQVRKEGDHRATRRDLTSFILGLVGGFAILNLPFLLWRPGDWFRGVFSPMLDSFVPDGQGLSLLASRGFLPIPQMVFSLAMVVAMLVALFVYFRRFDRMKNMLWVLPPALLFFSHRSLHNYFIFWIPIAALWLDLEGAPYRLQVNNVGQGRTRGHRRRAVAIGVSGAVIVSGLIGLILSSGDSIKVRSVEGHVSGGVVTALDVEVLNLGKEPLQPVFEIYWGRYPVPWESVAPIQIEPEESGVVRIVPASRGVIPPLKVSDDGSLQLTPFRVRVNDRGHSIFASSQLVELSPIRELVVNPDFGFWGQSGPSDLHSPFGWTSAPISLPGTSAQTRTLGGGRGASMTVAQVDPARAGWGEAALVQDVSAVASCYRLTASYDYEYSASEEGRPLAAAGVQVLQGGSAIWFVLSDNAEARVTHLPEGTRIVEVPATMGQVEDVVLEVSALGAESGIESGQPGTIKLFSALHESEPGPLDLRVGSLTECTES